MLQIRITNFDGTEPVILENAIARIYSEAINSADEGISFEIAKNDPKAEGLNPDTTGYLKFWQVWDTSTNRMLNFGPILNISDSMTRWKITGAGRAALLADFYINLSVYQMPIYQLFEKLSFENLAIEPRTSTVVADTVTSGEQTLVFGSTVIINEKYHGLSKQTKDNAIDDSVGTSKLDRANPNYPYVHDSFWSGMDRADTHIVDLGAIYDVNRIVYNLPSWGGPTRYFNRAYTYEIAVATDEGSTTSLQDREFGTFTTIYTSDNPNQVKGGVRLYIGMNGSNIEVINDREAWIPTIMPYPPVPVRYVRMKILNTHSWGSNSFEHDEPQDSWEKQCNPDYIEGSGPSSGPAQMVGPINERTLEPANNCHASISEIAIEKEIVNINNIAPLALQKIDNNNPQIRYSHTAEASETETTSNGYRKFEPGSFFRRIRFTYSGASTTYNTFFESDCANCFPDGFQFGMMDNRNSLVYATDNSSGTNVNRTIGAYTSSIQMKGASNAVVTWADAWPAKTDPLSYGGSYSHTQVVGDTAIIHFRGESFKWFATVPEDETGAEVEIEIRSKSDTNEWGSWSTLDTITLDSGISARLVYEIPYDSGILLPETTYQIRLTNNDGGWLSIDSIEGYWAASMIDYNEDSARFTLSQPEHFKQIYDQRFSGGSMYKIDDTAFVHFGFIGDRFILLSAKGRMHGKCRLIIQDVSEQRAAFDPTNSPNVEIPGGDPDGFLQIDLTTGKRGSEIAQYVLFDSDDYFTDGLPWKQYSVKLFLASEDKETYTSSTADIEFDSFVERCRNCNPPSGTPITVNKPIFFDGALIHEQVGLSVSFNNETHLEALRSTAEALQVEWTVDADGILIDPRLGEDTEVYLREGENTLVDWEMVNDISQMATILLSNGADIDGLPLFTITEDKETRARVGRTIMRQNDFRSLGDYMQLIGLSRTELRRRAYPEKRIRVTHTAEHLGLQKGDSFVLWTKKSGPIRVRIERKETNESSGRIYNLECLIWPQIV